MEALLLELKERDLGINLDDGKCSAEI